MNVHLYTWVITALVLVTVLAIDLLVIGRRPHEPSMKEAGLFVGIYVALAVLFGFGVWGLSGAEYAGQFFAGWLTEYSLSLDNLFIFIILMGALKVPRHLQQFALMVGIVLALVFRGVFIAVGAAVIERFAWVFFAFGAFLVYTAVRLVIDYRKHDDEEDTDNALLRLARRRLPFVDDFHGTAMSTHVDGRRVLTAMALVVLALGSTDLLFALDSIPAIYGLTQEPYLVFTANVFALMGLRQLYFLIGGLLRRLVYLSLGLSVILAFIGVKLVMHALHEYEIGTANLPFEGEIPTWVSLTVIVSVLLITTFASLIRSRYLDDTARADTDRADTDRADPAGSQGVDPDGRAPVESAETPAAGQPSQPSGDPGARWR